MLPESNFMFKVRIHFWEFSLMLVTQFFQILHPVLNRPLWMGPRPTHFNYNLKHFRLYFDIFIAFQFSGCSAENGRISKYIHSERDLQINHGTFFSSLSINSSPFTYFYKYSQHLLCAQHSLCGYNCAQDTFLSPKQLRCSQQ